MKYSDDDLLRIVGEERKRSIGFGDGDSGELTEAREKALAYFKGDMKDIGSLPGRSSVVDTAVADAIETVMPDVMEVFVGGEDVATFVPMDEADEDRAQEETDFVKHVVFTENEGFLTLYSAIKDSLLTRTGVFHWWWEEDEKTETVADNVAEEMAAAIAQAQPELQQVPNEDGTISLTKTHLHGKVKIQAVPSEDFTVARDTVSLRDATYCAMRSRPRVQELIQRGVDPDKARQLKAYSDQNGAVRIERDEAGENDLYADSGIDDLRTVEVRAHYIRLAGDDGKLTVWCVVTDAEERLLLHSEEVGIIPFAALTPYIVPHRFYGESVADKLIEVQRIKTALLRMLLDSGYFALNQRNYVDMTKANEFTIADLLANEPGRPVRGNGEGAVVPIGAGSLNFDVLSAMEYVNTVAETRSGIVRNAQGLNPDTLHETKGGMMQLVMAAQKRVRMIARIFAETGIKDLFLGVHALLRQGHGDGYAAPKAKIGSLWKEVKPGQWPERCAMTVHVGVGSAGREHDMAIATQRLELMERVMMAGVPGIVDPNNLHNALSGWERAAGSKTPELYWSDPSQKPPAPPQPDPEVVKAQGQLELQKQKAAADVQLTREKAQVDAQTTAQKHQMDAAAAEAKAQREHELAVARMEAEMQLKREQIAAELDLKREQLAAELELKRQLGFAQAAVAHEVGMTKASVSTSEVEPGGEAG